MTGCGQVYEYTTRATGSIGGSATLKMHCGFGDGWLCPACAERLSVPLPHGDKAAAERQACSPPFGQGAASAAPVLKP